MLCRPRQRDPNQTYRSAGVTFVQRRFPPRTLVVNNFKPCLLMDDQSTLTQLDFGTPRSSCASATDIGNVNADRHRRKRRKHNPAIRRQTTLTQLDWSFSSAASDEDLPELDAEHDHLRDNPQREPAPHQTRPERRSNHIQTPIACSRTPDVHRTTAEIPSSQSPLPLPDYRHSKSQDLTRSSAAELATNVRGRTIPARTTTDAHVFVKPALPRHRTPPRPGRLPSKIVKDHRSSSPDQVIQDSQYDSLGQTIDLLCHESVVIGPLPTQNDPYQETQLTAGAISQFPDPACSALDRDAARFMADDWVTSTTQPPQASVEHQVVIPGTVFAAPATAAVHEHDTEVARTPPASRFADRTIICDSEDDEELICTSPYETREDHVIDLTNDDAASMARSFEFPSSMQQTTEPAKVKDEHCSNFTSSPPMALRSSQASTVGPTQPLHLVSDACQDLSANPEEAEEQHGEFQDQETTLPVYSPASSLDVECRGSTFSLYTSDSTFIDLDANNRDCEEVGGVATSVAGRARRLKRAHEVLPDSLLDMSLPAAPLSDVPDLSLSAPDSSWRRSKK